MSGLPLSYLQALNQPQRHESLKNPPAFDFIPDPTKKIKHNQQNFTESNFKVEVVPHQQEITKKEEDLLTQSSLIRNLPLGGQPIPQEYLRYNEGLQALLSSNFPGAKKPLNFDQVRDPSGLTVKEDLASLNFNNQMLSNLFGLSEAVKNQQMEQSLKQQLIQQQFLQELGQLKEQQRAQQLYQQQMDYLAQQQYIQQLQQNKGSEMAFNALVDSQRRLMGQQQNPSSVLNEEKLKKNTILLQNQVVNAKAKPAQTQQSVYANGSQWTDQGYQSLRKTGHGELRLTKGAGAGGEEADNSGMEILGEMKQEVVEMNNQNGKKVQKDLDNKLIKSKEGSDGTAKGKQKEAAKKRRAYNYSYNYLNSIAGKSIDQADRLESRRENKWQMMKNQEGPNASGRKSTRMNSSRKSTLNEETEVSQTAGSVEVGNPAIGEIEGSKPNQDQIAEEDMRKKKEMEEDETAKDYHYLINVTITRDPDNVGLKNAGHSFVVIEHSERMRKHYELYGEEAPMETKVGKEYQATIPELDLSGSRVEPKKRRCELVWNPRAVDEADIGRYLNDLCKLLNCENVNQEKALKLLKRKNYKKDKVKVNISKNEKFYSSFLVVTDITKEIPKEFLTEYTDM